jgi:hypothetical protein
MIIKGKTMLYKFTDLSETAKALAVTNERFFLGSENEFRGDGTRWADASDEIVLGYINEYPGLYDESGKRIMDNKVFRDGALSV